MSRALERERKRDAVADVAADLIAKAGLGAVTVREVAAAAGFSTTVVTHYFTDKRELLLHTYRFVADRAQRRFDRVLAADPGDLQGCLEAVLPLDDERRRDCKVWFMFWSAASDEPALGREQRGWVVHARGVVERVMRQHSPDGDVASAARRLLVMVMGLAVQAVFDPRDWPAARQRAFLKDEIGRVTAGT